MRSKTGWWLAGLVVVCNIALAQETSTTSMKLEEPRTSRPFGFHGNWMFDVGGGNAQEGKDTWSAAYLYVSSNLYFKFHEQLRAHIAPMARLYGGRAQERYDDDSLDSRVGVHEAYVAYSPFQFLELKAGGHSQSIVQNSMLVSGLRSFAGFQEIIKAESGDFKARVVAQQVIPNSYSLNTEREKQEALPWFRTEHAEFEGKHWNWFEWKAMGGLYEWNDIPSKVVYESVRIGNAPLTTPTPAGSRFAYGHQGWFGGTELCYCDASNVNFVGEFKRVHNTRAPGDAADAQMWGFGPKVKWKNRELDFRYRSYFIESDATVAAYNKSRLGNTNRIGENIEVYLRFTDLKFALYGEMYKAKPINTADVQQRDMEQYYFGLETEYVSF